ncbi:MAG: signal peptidase II [Lachnospiraceae bacterium]|nr:signal peptidase II [Lachnospiraceae bacterium]
MIKKKLIPLFLDLLFIVLLILGDQYSKAQAILHLKNQDAYILFDKVLELHYLENHGAAFGILQNQTLFFVFIAMLIFIGILFVLIKMPPKRKYVFMHVFLVLIACGAIGNMIDRVRFGFVVDFIYFVLIDFPIFNVADIYVTVGTALLILFLLFYYKEDDLKFLKLKIENNNLRF